MHAQPLFQQAALGVDHVVVAVVREARAQAVAGLARLAMADAVAQDDVVTRRVQHAARPEQLAGKLRPQELGAAAAGAVRDQHGVVHHASRVALRRADGAVMNAQFGQFFTGRELEILEMEIALDRRGIVGRAGSGQGQQQDEA